MIVIYNLLALLRMLTFGVTVVCFFATTVPLYPIYLIRTNEMRSLLVRILAGYSRWTLFFMGVRVKEIGLTDQVTEHLKKKNYLVVGNHMSYLDVVIVGHLLPSSFITSVEMRDVPFLGEICKLGGCVFVERRNKKNLGGEIKEIVDSLRHGLSITIFPEATSTNGEEVIRFKRPLFRAAMETDTPILPITINYLKINNKAVTKENRDILCWYGDMTFPDHIWEVFKTPTIDISITIAEPMLPNNFEDHIALSEAAHLKVASNFKPFKSTQDSAASQHLQQC